MERKHGTMRLTDCRTQLNNAQVLTVDQTTSNRPNHK